jgi:hypothetical protein
MESCDLSTGRRFLGREDELRRPPPLAIVRTTLAQTRAGTDRRQGTKARLRL